MGKKINQIDIDKIYDFAYDYVKAFLSDELKVDESVISKALLEQKEAITKFLHKVCIAMIESLTYTKTNKMSLRNAVKIYSIAFMKDIKEELEI
jgi:hypothetical protein